MKTREDGWIYFIQEAVDGSDFVKIGFANDVDERLRQLQTGNPHALVLMARTPGDSDLEAQLHRIHRRDRVRGEWFKMNDELRELIRDLKRDEREGWPYLQHTNSRLNTDRVVERARRLASGDDDR